MRKISVLFFILLLIVSILHARQLCSKECIPSYFNQTFTTDNNGLTDKFVYQKGKSFKDVQSYPMKKGLNLEKQSSPILYEYQIPKHQNTLSYQITLPNYASGIYFSRDTRPGDFEWPNNTNRLLPWTFKQLKELTQDDYPGIPSNGHPSVLGDALLLQLTNGEYMFAKAITGPNSISWFQVNTDGTMTLYVSTLGQDNLSGNLPLLLIQKSQSIYNVFQEAYNALIFNKEVSNLKRRDDKDYFEAFRYLGWCTYEHYHGNINEKIILKAIDEIEASGIPIRYLLIDDGHITVKNHQIASFIPKKDLFPNGWEPIMKRKKENKIKWMGLWYCLSGYYGISPDNDFPPTVQKALYKYNGPLLPGRSNENIQTFYQYYVQMTKKNGFDFLKTDNQSFTLPLYMGSTQVIQQAKECNVALAQQTHMEQMGLINCMAQNVVNTDHTQYSTVTRVSIDYKKYDENRAKSHIFQSYTNTLLLGQTIWPDHDMFHSCDTVCGGLMARSKAISGGPVYLSDPPENFVKELIFPLIDKHGKIFRPSAPAVPTPESIFTNPLWNGKAYRVFAPTGNEAVSLICYNLNVSPKHQQVTAYIRPSDYQLRGSITEASSSVKEHILLYDWNAQTAEILFSNKPIELKGFTDQLFHLCPIRQGWGIIGIQEKYLSPATVEILSRTIDKLILNVQCTGTLKIWVESDGKQELRSIPIKQTGKVELIK